ncbi:MAG: hypothetical protein ACLU0O_00610 [Collinsella sp.]
MKTDHAAARRRATATIPAADADSTRSPTSAGGNGAQYGIRESVPVAFWYSDPQSTSRA